MKYSQIIFLILFCHLAYAQMDSVFDQGMYRTFILHLLANYDENEDYPLVFNFHGLGSNAFEQLLY